MLVLSNNVLALLDPSIEVDYSCFSEEALRMITNKAIDNL